MAQGLYVGGFVDVVSCPKLEQELYLDPDQVTDYLPVTEPLPITIEHLPETEVGWTLGLFQVSHGIFCTGAITSPAFLELASRLADTSHVARAPVKNLPKEPLLEILHTWLPGLSLSSIHPRELSQTPSGPVFQHVSLCALGRRRGTVAVYGHDAEWVVSRFSSVSQSERAHILQHVSSCRLEDLSTPNFVSPLETLMAKAIDASFIRDRLDLLKTDRGVASILSPAYLKASQLPVGIQAVTPPRPAMNSSGQEDIISIPKSAFLSMLQSSIDGMKTTAAKMSHTLSGPGLTGCGGQMFPTDHHLPSYVSNPAPPYGYAYKNPYDPWYYSPQLPGYRTGKRKRGAEDDEGHLFPGEEPAYHKDILSMSKNIAEIQSELKEMKLNGWHAGPPPSSSAAAAAVDPHYRPHANSAAPCQFPTMKEHGGTYVHPPIYVQAPHGQFQQAAPILFAQPHVSHPPVSTGLAVVGAPPAEPTPASSTQSIQQQAPETTHTPCAAVEKDAPTPNPTSNRVEASSRSSPKSKIRKMFCEELLNKQ
uniref:Capsid scaffolding protein n=2 Tax=Human herpesvirus 8 TaxID=37296 RepID=A0A0N9SCX2_HHV8|nr:ORF17 [Human gammaherpesvirus 8]